MVGAMATDKDGYFINDTGKTIQEVVRETRNKLRGYPPLSRATRYWVNGKGWVKGIAVNFIDADDENLYTLSEKDLADIDPDEPILLGNGSAKRLGDTAVYKRAVKELGKLKAEPKPKKPAGKSDLQKVFDEWKVEPAEPINDITDIFKDYNK